MIKKNNRENIIFTKMKNICKKYKIALLVSILAVASICLLIGLSFAKDKNIIEPKTLDDTILEDTTFEYKTVSITPTKLMAKGVAKDTQFHIVMKQNTTVKEIKNIIKISPEMKYDVEEIKKNEFLLTAAEPFKDNEVFNILEQGQDGRISKSWAFQTEGTFRILESYPTNGSTYMSNMTGIEITFSSPDVEIDEIKKNVVFEPSVEFEVKRYNSTYVLTHTGLENGQSYKVTIKSTLKNSAGDQLGEDYTFEFETRPEDDDTYFNFAFEGTHSYTTNDLPVITVLTSNNSKDKYKGEIYQFNSAQDYKEYLSNFVEEDKMNLSLNQLEMTLIHNFDITINLASDNYTEKIVLPNKLDFGYYALVVKQKENDLVEDIITMQITDLGVYATSDEDKAIIWVNDANLGGPANQAFVQIEMNGDKYETRTNASGLATFNGITIDYQSNAILSISTVDNKKFIDTISNNTEVYNIDSGSSEDLFEDYFSYIYTDRGGYMPSDTIRVWGVIRPRREGTPIPNELEITLTESYRANNQDFYKTKIKLSKDGVFNASIPYEDLSSDTYYVNLVSEFGTHNSNYVRIEEYVKPIYIIKSSSSQLLYDDYKGEDIVITTDLSLYDGTAAADMNLKVDYYYSSYNTNINLNMKNEIAVTNKDGIAKHFLSISEDGYGSPSPRSIQYSVSNHDEGSEYIGTSGNFYLVNRDVLLESSEGKDVDGKYVIELNTNLTDYSQITSPDDIYNRNKYIGAPFDTVVNASVTLYEYVKSSLGFVYDPVYNENVERFRYDTVGYSMGDFEIRTVDGKAIFDQLPLFNEDGSYYQITYHYTDSQGRLTLVDQTYYNSTLLYDYYGYTNERYTLNSKEYKFDSNTPATFKLTNNYAKDKIADGSFFYYTISKRINEFQVTTSDQIQIDFNEKLVPNFMITGAFFDGTHVFNVGESYVRYNYMERKVDIQIEADKEKYAPSSKAKVTIRVVDQANQPIPNTNVLVSMVDEALFALYYNDDDILRALYAHAYSSNYMKYVSYIPNDLLLSGGAEMGGGDGNLVSVRSDFEDTAIFANVETDKNGYATVELKLPDNITSWRITALALTDDMQAGSNRKNIIVTRDIYITPIVNSQYIYGDDVAVTLKSAGDQATTGEGVEYEVVVSNGKKENDITQKINSLVGKVEVANFGKLPIGKYTIQLSAKSQGYSDAMLLDFEVIDSGINTILYKEYNLRDKISLNAKQYPVNLTFYNSEYKQYQAILNSLSCTRLIRKDEKVALIFMKEMFAQSGNDFSWITANYPYSDIIRGDGGVGELDGSSSNVEFTARLCAAYPEFFNHDKTIQYLSRIIADKEATENQVTAAYMGLAALKQPVIYDIKYLLEEVELDELSRLYLIAGLALIGDSDGALQYYKKDIKPNLTIDKITEEATFSSEIDYNPIYLTAIASITTSILNTEESEMVIQTLISNSGIEYLLLCEKMVYIKYFVPLTQANSTFEYTLDGKKIRKSIDKLGYVSISVSKEQYKDLDLKLLTGNVDVSAKYVGAITEADITKNQIKVEKTITEYSKTEKLVTIKVTLPTANPDQTVIVDDYIPSGGRYTGFIYEPSGNGAYLANQEKQRIRFIYQYGSSSFTIKYRIRTIIPGDYVMEGAVATINNSVTWGTSYKGTVKFSE